VKIELPIELVPKHITVSLVLWGVIVDLSKNMHQNMCSVSGVLKISEKHVHIDDHYSDITTEYSMPCC
jgi:hypothetical protein